jgi:hypothetical protein
MQSIGDGAGCNVFSISKNGSKMDVVLYNQNPTVENNEGKNF